MTPIQKTQSLDKYSYYQSHLEIINVLLPTRLTPMEVQVLATFMSLDGDIANDRFGTSAKKIVRQKLTLSHGGLSNYIRVLKEKGFIINEQIHPRLIADSHEQVYMFKLINDETLNSALTVIPISTIQETIS